MLPALDLDLIRTFLTVLSEGGIKSAALQLNKTPSAISMQLKRLEEQLGQCVLIRNNRGIALTDAGKLLKSRGEHLIRINNQLIADLRDTEISGTIRLGAPSDYAPTLLSKLLPVLLNEFPKMEPRLTLEPSRLLRKKVSSGQLDVAIVARETHSNEGHHLWTEPLAWYGDFNLQTSPFSIAVLSIDCILRDTTFKTLESHGVEHKVVLESSAVSSLKDSVNAGFSLALLPTSLEQDIQKPKVAITPAEQSIEFALVTSDNVSMSDSTDLYRRLHRVL